VNSIFGKLRDFVGINEQEDYDYYDEEIDGEQYQYQEEPAPAVPTEERSLNRKNRERPTVTPETTISSHVRSNVIGMPRAVNGFSEVVVIEPRSFEEMPEVIQALRERKSVVLNLNIMDPDEAQRSVDFIAGGTYAIDGHQERIGESIFLFTPNCVQVSTHSGVVHEVEPPVPSTFNNSVPAPSWSAEPKRMAQ
jgi:cell division inhibitor SepF